MNQTGGVYCCNSLSSRNNDVKKLPSDSGIRRTLIIATTKLAAIVRVSVPVIIPVLMAIIPVAFTLCWF